MTKAECIRELQAEYQEQRTQNERDLDARIAEAGRIDPEIMRLREENASLALETLRRIMAMHGEDERREAAEQMKREQVQREQSATQVAEKGTEGAKKGTNDDTKGSAEGKKLSKKE